MAKVLIGVCGGVAAYKTCDLVRELQQHGHQVKVVMTSAAMQFIQPLQFSALTHQPTYTDLFEVQPGFFPHIDLARWADVLLIAPATAETLAKAAQGHAPDLLSTVYLAFKGPVLWAPAMNSSMWQHPAVVNNVNTLRARNEEIIEPVSGTLACGEQGVGKMADINMIHQHLMATLSTGQTLTGKRVVVTAGATREYLDPVRFLSSPATGKMGLAFATCAEQRGAKVTFIHGPMATAINIEGATIAVTSAADMLAALDSIPDFDVLISAAAVADYTWSEVSDHKIKKGAHEWSVTLKPTPDILHTVSARRQAHQVLVGFAAETTELESHARQKLYHKQLDMIVANRVNREQVGFAQDITDVTVITGEQTQTWHNISKTQVAQRCCDIIEHLLAQKPQRQP